MTSTFDRRAFCKSFALSAAAGLAGAGGGAALAATPGLKLGPEKPFTFEALQAQAKKMSGESYVGPGAPAPDILDKIDYDAWGKIRFNNDFALNATGPNRFPVTFFHLGRFFKKAVAIHVVENGKAREIIYDQSYFDMPADSPAKALPKGVGFAGFRFQEPKDGTKYDWHGNDWVAFLGASYFRAIGSLHQYGLSARGVALDTAVADRNEEFPDFTKIYIGPQEGDSVTIFALLEGPKIVGAVKFVMARGEGVVMDIDQAFYLRGNVARFGVAPLTSMYWFSETAKPTMIDWRPEVHDSDGLAMWTGWGGRLWRPLNDPPHIMASAFSDINPKGFGLLQRDRVFDHYIDGVNYEKRPSLWVEPKGEWGKGAIHLVELTTDDEIHDNIVAMWVPDAPAVAGSEFHFSYRLHWQADEPFFPANLARVVATRLGRGGQPGQPRPPGVRKFLIEFLGGPLADLPKGVMPELDVSASRGTFGAYRLMEAVPDDVPGHWRVQFDLANIEGNDPVELRAFLKLGDRALSETWMFQYHPMQPGT
ncbi:glucans biosynthesis protein [Rhodoblastus acidophilus]|uniref:Glucans biosynthesis protein n=1 Tax=Rhodoblastus acidophilus TaxID=1074 RepID=A0A212RPU8_RHOAC|nr:glucan biosynthesis protein D [Rhodoblastus acidophilus]PPQ36739.1 glucan biosynthesis protein D [Rhodoblastus acidophilus]RAI21464.1 glucan biosynthesis protein D [Rhodoblastus acidophilus]SNB74423.1 glucans biosynthesis protein [Rhodoblastus acidophilus]